MTIPNDIAVPLSLIVNELLTNSIQHAKPIGERELHVVVKSDARHFSVAVSDPGIGPIPGQALSGLGTRLVEALASQINATLTRESSGGRYTVTVSIPHLESDQTQQG